VGSPCWSRFLPGPVALWRHRSLHQSGFAGRACDPMWDPRWSSLFLKDCTSRKGPTLGQFVKDCLPWEGPTLEQLVKSCSPWEGLTLEKFVENCVPWVGLHAGDRAECEESSP